MKKKCKTNNKILKRNTFFSLSRTDNEEMVELMLKNGGNGEITNNAGETVLSWAASRGKHDSKYMRC